MKKVFKFLGLGIVVLIIISVIAGFIANEPMPTQRKSGAAADELARKMEAAVNKAAWDQTRFVSWKFLSGTSYVWDKEKNAVVVTWGDNKVLLNTPTRTGLAYVDGQLVTDAVTKQKLLDKAWSQFANDSFWLCAPMKAFDPGTRREIATNKAGEEGLLVHYSSGGVTPGDSYLWLLDESGKPKAWQMWVNIIPIGGLQFSWEDWSGGPNGPQIAQQHDGVLLDVPIKDLTYPVFTDETSPLKALWD
ncbi:hypothetical protein [Lewinella sp. LCG006]|uniref:hypothetical protein n=1 Tax=Lewinella sp. LCG006 TaxID=3231911 RepID=UPI0034611D2F